jgi:hypothetical protein
MKEKVGNNQILALRYNFHGLIPTPKLGIAGPGG